MLHGLNNTFLYAACQIKVTLTDGKDSMTSSGTGFFIAKESKLFFITNRHVVDIARRVSNYVGYTTISNIIIIFSKYDIESKSVKIKEWKLEDFQLAYAEDDNDDIACLYNIGIKEILIQDPPVYISYGLLATKEQYMNELSIFDNLAMIGFPIVHDHKNHTAIVRQGIISSDPRLDYSYNTTNQGHCVAYEAFSTEGASGSPIFATQKGFPIGEGLEGPENFYRPLLLIGINASNINRGDQHQHMSCLYKSVQIIELIDKIERTQKKD